MRTMLSELRLRLDQAITNRVERPMVHVELDHPRVGEDAEQLHAVVLEDVGEDFIQIRGRLIDRKLIREIQPINF